MTYYKRGILRLVKRKDLVFMGLSGMVDKACMHGMEVDVLEERRSTRVMSEALMVHQELFWFKKCPN